MTDSRRPSINMSADDSKELLSGQTESPTDLIQSTRTDIDLKTKELSPEQKDKLFAVIKDRFEAHPERHQGVEWERVKATLEKDAKALWSIQKLEENGGMPDVFMTNDKGFIIGDCFEESPDNRLEVTYDKESEEILKKKGKDEAPLNGNAVDNASEFGAELMDREQFNKLLSLGKFANMVWLKTPEEVRRSGYAYCGFRDEEKGVMVNRFLAHNNTYSPSFRCVVEVKWA